MPEPREPSKNVDRRLDELHYRLRSLEGFRREYRPKIDGLINQTLVEEAVKSALQTQRRHFFTLPQKIVGFVVSFAAIFDVFYSILRGTHG